MNTMKMIILLTILSFGFIMLLNCKDKRSAMENDLFEQIPDSAFRAYCKRFDINGDGKLSMAEAKAVKVINLRSDYETAKKSNNHIAFIPLKGTVASLEGIKLFPNIIRLYCVDNMLTDLDVSGLTKLKELNCLSNEIINLNVDGCTALTTLHCNGNMMTSLDVSSCTALTGLSCPCYNLTSLNVTGCKALIWIVCSYSQLTEVDISTCASLKEFVCMSTPLVSLNASGCTSLTSLAFYENKLLSKVDVSGCTALEKLTCSDNQLTDLDISACKKLTRLVLRNCPNPVTVTVWQGFNTTKPHTNFEYYDASNSKIITFVEKEI